MAAMPKTRDKAARYLAYMLEDEMDKIRQEYRKIAKHAVKRKLNYDRITKVGKDAGAELGLPPDAVDMVVGLIIFELIDQMSDRLNPEVEEE